MPRWLLPCRPTSEAAQMRVTFQGAVGPNARALGRLANSMPDGGTGCLWISDANGASLRCRTAGDPNCR